MRGNPARAARHPPRIRAQLCAKRELCAEMRACGADLFVAGSSSLYQKGLDIREAVTRMTELVR